MSGTMSEAKKQQNRFALLKAILAAKGGLRGKKDPTWDDIIANLDDDYTLAKNVGAVEKWYAKNLKADIDAKIAAPRDPIVRPPHVSLVFVWLTS
jgi:hypothetical protein